MGVAAMKIAEAFTVQDYGVVVTGGGSGLGLCFAGGLAENGARVPILDIAAQRVAEETESLRGKGLDVRGEVLDFTDHLALDKAIDSAAAAYERLDVVFAN